ncbi:helix-turn-helix domain-containing protein [Lactiplantibacillus herbarum]|uniref:helix-turn-helix domain-containing protein n=1 Tax=Lactiplantibacillus herbarum TaxID=1670446 RepID=UPI00064EF3C6|nr:helix-turn-helix domain-containing protein [Lactiplantibacillus herbarum]
MSRFNFEFRTEVVSAYLAGKGSTTLAKEYGVSNASLILNWAHRFERFGIEGLKYRAMDQDYSSQFKSAVLNWRKQNQASLPVTALQFNLPSPSTIWQWEQRFEKLGIAGLERKRGNPKTMAKHKNKPAASKSVSASDDAQAQLKQLEKENEMLKIENRFLKKLDALARKKSAQKNSRD